MPVIFQGQCQTCQYKSPHTSGGYAAVVVDEPVQRPDSHPDDPRIVVLAHPLESQILNDLGYTFSSATLAGRFLIIQEFFCKSCGNLYEVRKLGTSPVVGCIPSLIGGVLCGIIAGTFTHDLGVGFITGLAVVSILEILLGWLIDPLISLWYRERAREFRTQKRCPKCGDTRGVCPGSRRAVVPCPSCGQTSMQIKTIGIS